MEHKVQWQHLHYHRDEIPQKIEKNTKKPFYFSQWAPRLKKTISTSSHLKLYSYTETVKIRKEFTLLASPRTTYGTAIRVGELVICKNKKK